MMLDLSFKDMIWYTIKRIPLIVTFTLFFGLLGSIYLNYIKKTTYSTYTTIVLAHSNNDILSQEEIELNKALLPTYKEVLKSKRIMKEVIDQLNLSYTIQDFYQMVKVNSSKNSDMIKISVNSSNKEQIIDIANKVVEVFSTYIKEIYQINNIKVVEPATYIVTNNNYNTYLLLFMSIGILLSLLVILFGYFFDNSIKSEKEIKNKFEIPLLGVLPIFDNSNKIICNDNIKNIRTNILFSNVDKKHKTILITSSNPNEGKSFVSSNLACSFSELGLKTLLVDCDMRKGRLHYIFESFNKNGLSNLLISDNLNFENHFQKTNINNLSLLTMGVVPPNPSELIGSTKFDFFIQKIKDNFDIIIFDSPPINAVSDAIVLSKKVDQVVVVSKANTTTFRDLEHSTNSVKRANGNLIGIVFNLKDLSKHNEIE